MYVLIGGIFVGQQIQRWIHWKVWFHWKAECGCRTSIEGGKAGEQSCFSRRGFESQQYPTQFKVKLSCFDMTGYLFVVVCIFSVIIWCFYLR
jgi:hypothetical protein